jgi:hypothetical protein
LQEEVLDLQKDAQFDKAEMKNRELALLKEKEFK